MKRKLLSVLLTLCLAFSLLPTAALAEEGEASGNVAKIGEQGYATLAEAIAAANDGQTVKMLNNTKVTQEIYFSGKTITLDLNGKIITGQFEDYYSVIEAQGTAATLIVEDTSAGKTGTIHSNHYGLTARDDGNITVNSGTIIGDDSAALSGNNTTGNMNFTVNGGTLTAGKGPAIYQSGQCNLTITGGTLNGGISLRMGQVNISGGTINATASSIDSPAEYYDYSGNAWLPDALYVFGGTYDKGDKTYGNSLNLNITGGTFNCTNGQGSAVAIYDLGKVTQTANINISGGKFATTTNGRNAYDVLSLKDIGVTNPKTGFGEHSGAVSSAISGGTFSSDVSAYVAEGYVQNENGTVEQLGETNAVAKVGNTYYKSLVDAYAAMVKMCSSAASEPIVITLLKDSEGGGMGSDKDPALNYVIDFNGHTYTVGAPAVGSTGTVSQGLRVLKGSTAKFMNGTLKAANYEKLRQVVHTYGDVTFENFTVDATGDPYAWAAVEPDAGSLKILGNSSILAREGQYGLYAAFWHIDSYNGTTVDVDTTGKITGKLAYEFDEDYTGENKATENKGSVNIKNGNFDILSIQEIWSDVSDAVDKNVGGIIISGGYFTSDPSSYKAADRYVVASDVDGYTYMVTATAPTDDQKITVVDKTNASVDPSITGNDKTAIDSAMSSGKTNVDGVAEAVTPAKKADIVSKSNANPGDNDKVEIEVAVKVVAKTADLAKGQLTFEASPEATVKVNGTAKGTTVPVSNAMLNGKPITVKLPLPTVDGKLFTPKQIKHTSSDGSVEYFLDTQKTGAKTFEIKDDCAVFKITKFSTFELSGKVTYVAPSYSGGSSSDPTYSVSTPSKTEHGTVTVSPKSASKGDTVTVTVKPDSGYVLETLTVTDKNGNELTLKDKGNGKYTFTMPAGKVEVKATFMEDNSMLNFFYDVPNNAYFYEAVKWAVKNGITTGVGNDLFAPEQPCTRAQIVTFLWRAAGSPEPKGAASGMTDVVSGGYYEKAVAWAIENGITTGTTTTTFSPDATCTRAQAVTFLARALKAKAASAAEFSDVPTGSYFADAVAWAAANGVTEGIGGGLFGSDNDCTRGQIVTFLYRAYNK